MANEISGLSTRGEIADQVADFIQDVSTNRRTMILRDIDEGYREALKKHEWPQLLRWADTEITVLNNVAYLFTEKNIRTVLAFIDGTTPFLVQEFSLSALLAHTSGFTQIQGVPSNVAHVGDFGIRIPIDAATSLEVLSSGTDVRTGWIKGLLSGELKSTSFTLTGTNVVNVGAWDEVYEFMISSSSTSTTITLRKVSDQTTASVIAPNERQAIYRRYRLHTLPSGTRPYRIIYKYTPPAVFDETHTFIIPIEKYLAEYAKARSFESRRQWAPAGKHDQMAAVALAETWHEIEGNRVDVSIPAAALMRQTQGAGIVINAYGYR